MVHPRLPECPILLSHHLMQYDGDEAYDHGDDDAVDGGDGEPHYFKQCW